MAQPEVIIQQAQILLKPTQIWYSWNGANQDIFFLIYGKFVDLAMPYLYILEFIGDYKNIAYYALLAAVLIGFKLVYRAITKNKIDGYYIRSQVAWILSFIIAYIIVVATVGFLKEFAAFPRPFIALSSSAPLLYNGSSDINPTSSFPSGHAAFTAFLLVIFWSRVFGIFRLVLVFTLIAMCWYRVSTGHHFPADVFYGAIIGLFFTGFIRGLMCKIFRVWR